MKKLRLYSLLLLICLLLTSCTGTTDTSTITADPNSKHLASEEPLTLTLHLHYAGGKILDSSWPVFQKATEYTNITLKSSVPEASSNSAEAYDLMVASGELTDIVAYVQRNKFMEDAMAGAYMPLDDYIDKYAPNIKAFFEKYPDAKKASTAPDGKIYGIANFPDQEVKVGMAWFIRQDWLEQLGLNVPESIDETYQVLKAFKTQDPNGNGIDDEIPFFSRGKSPAHLYQLWSAFEDFYVEDGKVKYGPYEPEYKDAMMNISKWYKEGLIDKEIYSRDARVRDILLSENQGGMTSDWISSTSSYNEVLKDKIEGFNFAPIAPPTSVDGERRYNFSRDIIAQTGWGISIKNKHPIETIKYFDFWFSEEGAMLQNFGIEGQDYNIVNGETIYAANVLNGDKPVLSHLEAQGAMCQGIGFPVSFEYERQAMSEQGRQAIDLYMRENYISRWQFPPVNYINNEQETFNRIMGNVTTYTVQKGQSWVMGAEDITSSYDEYISRLKQMEIDTAIAIQQAAYDRFQNQ